MPPDAMFQGATHRFADVAADAFENATTLALGPGPHTVMVSVRAEENFGVYLIEPAQRQAYSGIMLPGPRHGFTQFGQVEIQELRFTTSSGPAGDWTLAWGCGGPCTFAIAVEEGNHVPERGIHRTPSHGVTADAAGSYDFEVPRVRADAVLVTDVSATGGFSYALSDGAGERVAAWSWNDIYAKGWRHGLDTDAAAGTWHLDVDCGTCRFHIGIT